MLFLRFLKFLFVWLWFALKSFIFFVINDFIFVFKSLYYFMLLLLKNNKREWLKNIILFLYFVYPFYLFIKFVLLFYIIVLRYFYFFLFHIFILFNFLGFNVYKINFFFQKHLINSLYFYLNLNILLKHGLFSFLTKLLKIILLEFIYFIIYDFIPFLLLPFVIIFVYFRNKLKILNDLYLLKIFYPLRTTAPLFFRQLFLKFAYFYNFWFFAILKFLFFLIPFYS